jgi:hypothetical protein
MPRSTDRIRTTHVGSLARPAALLDLMRAAAQRRRAAASWLQGLPPTMVADQDHSGGRQCHRHQRSISS